MCIVECVGRRRGRRERVITMRALSAAVLAPIVKTDAVDARITPT